MNLLLHNASLHESAIQLYDEIGALLRDIGHSVLVAHGQHQIDTTKHNFLISNEVLPIKIRQQLKSCGGVLLGRAQSMTILQDSGLPVMHWSLAENAEVVDSLFGEWSCERMLLKKSFSFGGKGISVFTKDHPSTQLTWDPAKDIFCAEVDEESGDVYKAELFNGEIVISWMSEAPPLRELVETSYLEGIKGAYGERRLFEFPEEVAEQLKALSKELTQEGVGYVSLDLMKDATGNFRAIEINLSMIATWWTVQFEEMKSRFAKAISDWMTKG